MTPRASVVIVCFGKREVTERCLDSLDRCLGPALGREIELVLVDNASPDDTLELLARWQDRATVLALPENRNFAGGCNAGASAAQGDAVIFLNNDTVMEPGVLEALAETVHEPGVAAAGARLLYADGTVQHAGVAMVQAGTVASPFHVFHHHDGELEATRGTYEMDCVTGACLAVRRDVFAELGGFDEAYRNGYEDVDFCLRLRCAGHRIVYRGDLAFLHDEGATRAGLDDTPNQRLFFGRWAEMLVPDTELAAAAWGATVSARTILRDTPGAPLLVAGPVTGWGPAADELRALLVGFERAGIPVVAADHPVSVVRPGLAADTAAACGRALRRQPPEQALVLSVIDGTAGVATAAPGSVLRAPHQDAVAGGHRALVASPEGDGWIPPAILGAGEPGVGGAGIVVSLPAHDLPATVTLLDALAALPPDRALRLVPTVGARDLAGLVAARLPHAELLPPAAGDDAWGERMRDADIAICLGTQPYDRRALIAAAAGAAPIVGETAAAAQAVLGELAVVADAASLALACRAAETGSGARAARAARVAAMCDPTRIANQLLGALQPAPARVG